MIYGIFSKFFLRQRAAARSWSCWSSWLFKYSELTNGQLRILGALARIYRQSYVLAYPWKFEKQLFSHIFTSHVCVAKKKLQCSSKRFRKSKATVEFVQGGLGTTVARDQEAKKASGLAIFHFNGYVKVSSPTLTQTWRQGAGQQFHYIYTGLRLLMRSNM